MDVIDLPVGKQRYGLLLTDAGHHHRRPDVLQPRAWWTDHLFVIVNGACKVADIAHIRPASASLPVECPCRPSAAGAARPSRTALAACAPGVEKLVFMTGGAFSMG